MAQINLTELDFEQIRTSLRTYLQKQDTVKDLNFEGSAVNFLLDLLAYNTLYYAHYANMISGECFLDSAQLEKSIISLVKPLGYVVPTKTSARTRIQLKNVSDPNILTIPYTVSIRGKTPEGVDYQFWNIDSIPSIDPTTTEYFSVYEGSYVSLSYGGDGFDFPDQKILIADLNIDIQTLRVSVSRQGADFVYWKFLDTYGGSFVSDSSNLYTIERTSSGFVVKFQTTSSSTANLIGGDIVNLEYLSSNGSNANGTSVFTPIFPISSTVVNNLPSFGGLDAPDLDEAKRIAPLVFSAQQRLVTKSDYYGFLAQLGYSTDVNVWGGEDNSPPMYGRVLFSIANIGAGNNSLINNVISLIKERSIITVLPEYVSPRAVGLAFTLNVQFNKDTVVSDPVTTVELIKSKLNEAYPRGGYNNSLTKAVIKNTVTSFSGFSLNETLPNDLKLFVLVSPSTNIATLNFKNRIIQGTSTNNVGLGLFSSEFTSPYYNQGLVSIRDKPIIFTNTTGTPPQIGKLKLYTKDADGIFNVDLNAIVGDINYKTGVVTISPNIASNVFTVYVNPLYPDEIIAKDEVYLSLDITTTTPLPI
jgi:hypothetical protein